MHNLKVAIVELGGSHVENIYSQLLFLTRAGWPATLIYDERIASQVAGFECLATLSQQAIPPAKGLKRWNYLRNIRDYIIREGFDMVVFGTVSDKAVRDLLLMPWTHRPQYAGIVHDVEKFRSSFSHRLIARSVKKFFVLNDYLLENVPEGARNKYRIGVYYPVFFPPVKDIQLPQRKPGEIRIAVPGAVESAKRDYTLLFRIVRHLRTKERYRFILGNAAQGDGKDLITQIRNAGLEEQFVWWEGFVPFNELHAWVKSCDAVLPLVHPEADGPDIYTNRKMSGSFNLAFAYGKPLIMHQAFSVYRDFAENSIFYQPDKLAEILASLPEKLAGIESQLYQDPKWELNTQAERYLRFLQS